MKKLLCAVCAFAFFAAAGTAASADSHSIYPQYLNTTENLGKMYKKRYHDYPKYPQYLNTTENLK